MHVIVVIIIALLLKVALLFFGANRKDWKAAARKKQATNSALPATYAVIKAGHPSHAHQQKKVVVTGAHGFLARYGIDNCSQQGAALIVYPCRPPYWPGDARV